MGVPHPQRDWIVGVEKGRDRAEMRASRELKWSVGSGEQPGDMSSWHYFCVMLLLVSWYINRDAVSTSVLGPEPGSKYDYAI